MQDREIKREIARFSLSSARFLKVRIRDRVSFYCLPTTVFCLLLDKLRAVKNPSETQIATSQETLAEASNSTASSTRSSEIAPRNETLRGTAYSEDARAAMLTGRKWRRASRWIGLLVFALGALLMGWVFLQAIEHFRKLGDPGYLQFQINKIIGDPISQQVTAYVSVLGGEVTRFLYLLLLGALGSFIASRGIQFFAASESVIDEAVVPYE